MGESEEPSSPASAFEAGSASQDGGIPAVHETPEEPSAATLTLEEAKLRKRKEKMREFRKYLVDTHVVDALAKLLIALCEAEERPARPQEYFIDYFGEYRRRHCSGHATAHASENLGSRLSRRSKCNTKSPLVFYPGHLTSLTRTNDICREKQLGKRFTSLLGLVQWRRRPVPEHTPIQIWLKNTVSCLLSLQKNLPSS
ncbi:hypothetical protein TGME49_225102 [Toxoplasma gondii ME49]|uniref:Uncharacterized protein n=2 Tax=Toxoplasma gondii TaxID=5811 RepID=A0A086KME3_TOXGO|nr:hypothetical protein TGME49_225102 [Toxoplasma gondii ME49]EPT27014.1 hypothetical protein TGME49_225102 [Toxoplasma gondii ME49]KFG45561.1 hypothetical protein TGDOM2_225102 [Toxoplasma gondii GAB2-2007-GAL-DOM2]|eukprot:XP_018635977.1 hypothetical protein TGME49_225102 [Toxoplasma gondii ME49]